MLDKKPKEEKEITSIGKPLMQQKNKSSDKSMLPEDDTLTKQDERTQKKTFADFPVAVEEPYELLYDLRLPEKDIEVLNPLLVSNGFKISDEIAEEPIDEVQHQYNLVTRGREQWVFIKVSEYIIANPSRASRNALNDVFGLIADNNREAIFFIFSEVHAHNAINYLMKKFKEVRGIESKLIFFPDVRYGMSKSEAFQKTTILPLFPFKHESEDIMMEKKIPPEPEKTEGEKAEATHEHEEVQMDRGVNTVKDLDDTEEGKEDAKKLVEILEGQANRAPANLGVDGFLRNKINKTDWPDAWKELRIASLTGNADSDSLELIAYAIYQRRIPGKQMTALGSLLQSLLGDLGGDYFNDVNDIIKKYNLY